MDAGLFGPSPYGVGRLRPPGGERRDQEQAAPARLHAGEYRPHEAAAPADIDATTGRYAVLHDGARRLQLVTANVVGRDVASFVAEAQRRLGSEVASPAGTFAVFGGAAEAQAQARQQL